MLFVEIKRKDHFILRTETDFITVATSSNPHTIIEYAKKLMVRYECNEYNLLQDLQKSAYPIIPLKKEKERIEKYLIEFKDNELHNYFLEQLEVFRRDHLEILSEIKKERERLREEKSQKIKSDLKEKFKKSLLTKRKKKKSLFKKK